MKTKEKNKPQYVRLYQILRGQIESGAIAYGSRLPSKRVTAERYGVSLSTVEHALRLLEEEGYLLARQRRGYFACWQAQQSFPLTHAVQQIRHVPAPLPMPDSYPIGAYVKTVRRVLSEQGAGILGKTENAGLRWLREAIARYLHRARGIRVNAEQIIVGSGAEYLYSLVIFMLGTERRYAVEDPCYEKIQSVYHMHGITPTLLPLGIDGIRSDALAGSDAEVLHVTPYHSFPSGITATSEKRREYLAFAHARDAYLIEDDFGSEFYRARRPMQTLYEADAGERVIYVNTFTKTVSPGARIGYMIVPQALQPARARIAFLSCPVSALTQHVFAQLLDSGEFERHLNRIRRRLNKQ